MSTGSGVWLPVLVALTMTAQRTSARLRSHGLADQLQTAIVRGFGRAAGSGVLHAIGLPAGLGLVALVLVGSRLRRRPRRGARR